MLRARRRSKSCAGEDHWDKGQGVLFLCSVDCLFVLGGVTLFNFGVEQKKDGENLIMFMRQLRKGVVPGQVWVKKAEEMASELQATQPTAYVVGQPGLAEGRTSDSTASSSSCEGQLWDSLSSHQPWQGWQAIALSLEATQKYQDTASAPRQNPS